MWSEVGVTGDPEDSSSGGRGSWRRFKEKASRVMADEHQTGNKSRGSWEGAHREKVVLFFLFTRGEITRVLTGSRKDFAERKNGRCQRGEGLWRESSLWACVCVCVRVCVCVALAQHSTSWVSPRPGTQTQTLWLSA